MNSYSAKIAVEALTGRLGSRLEKAALVLEVKNHDMLATAERSKGRAGLDEPSSAVLAISPQVVVLGDAVEPKEPALR